MLTATASPALCGANGAGQYDGNVNATTTVMHPTFPHPQHQHHQHQHHHHQQHYSQHTLSTSCNAQHTSSSQSTNNSAAVTNTAFTMTALHVSTSANQVNGCTAAEVVTANAPKSTKPLMVTPPNSRSASNKTTTMTRPRSPRRGTKTHVASACINCKKAHLACDESRPCRRCVATKKTDTCHDVQHKKRGRPKLNRQAGGSADRRSTSGNSSPTNGVSLALSALPTRNLKAMPTSENAQAAVAAPQPMTATTPLAYPSVSLAPPSHAPSLASGYCSPRYSSSPTLPYNAPDGHKVSELPCCDPLEPVQFLSSFWSKPVLPDRSYEQPDVSLSSSSASSASTSPTLSHTQHYSEPSPRFYVYGGLPSPYSQTPPVDVPTVLSMHMTLTDFKIATASEGAYELWNSAPGDLVGSSLFDKVHPSDLEKLNKMRMNLMQILLSTVDYHGALESPTARALLNRLPKSISDPVFFPQSMYAVPESLPMPVCLPAIGWPQNVFVDDELHFSVRNGHVKLFSVRMYVGGFSVDLRKMEDWQRAFVICEVRPFSLDLTAPVSAEQALRIQPILPPSSTNYSQWHASTQSHATTNVLNSSHPSGMRLPALSNLTLYNNVKSSMSY